jgi:protein SCO1/2
MRRAFAALALVLLPFASLAADGTAAPSSIGIDQRLGNTVPLGAIFTDSDGTRLALGSLLGKPTILTLVYYRCPNVCDYLLTNVAGSLTALAADAGTGFNVVSISINDKESTADALKARRIALETVAAPFPPTAWRFLVGDAVNIRAVADAIGYHFVHNGDYFDHPVALMILSPSGKVVRYMYGESFLPAELKLTLLEARQGIIGASVARLLRVCFAVDPVSHRLVFRTLQVVATVTILVAAGFVLYLVLSIRRRRRDA